MSKLTTPVLEALCGQVTRERYSSAVYLTLACFCDERNLPGFAKWHRARSCEEMGHAQKLIDYILDRDGQVCVDTINAPDCSCFNVLETFTTALEHERKVSHNIEELASVALRANDLTTFTFMGWFLLEQVEEEKTLEEIIARYQLEGGPSLLEKELGS